MQARAEVQAARAAADAAMNKVRRQHEALRTAAHQQREHADAEQRTQIAERAAERPRARHPTTDDRRPTTDDRRWLPIPHYYP
ncbi:hypothetical protein [Actinomadura luteofluorescens]|uniref:hypothetical protein n=1 Tax=Actinomadura luteofluorescens TaxID=46163 RepID=UPI003D8C8E20